jgi:serine/threonine protein kinase/tetratricopeptide (TPR) repeat protein
MMENHPVDCPECRTKNPADSVFCNKCGTQFGLGKGESVSFTKTLLTTGEELIKGSTLAERYEIVEEIGKGGMGVVYKVFDTKIQEDIALKVLKPEVAAHMDTITRFSNELKFARRITHKNVCRMYDINDAAGTHFITMEYVEGENLKSVIRRMGKLRLGNVLSFALQVTDGLAEAHSLGIVHRDLKPQNIMIDREGNAKLMDFGIARSVEGKGLTVEGMVIGTPEYMSPEQVEGEKADQRSDIYSLGVILYEMVTGHVPFSGNTAFSVALKHKSEEPKDPRQANPELPEGLARAILRCMAKDRDRRYQSADELLAVLMAVEETLPDKERVVRKIMPRIGIARAKKLSLQKISTLALVAVVAIMAGIFAWRLMTPTQTIIPTEPGRLRVAVVPFQNNSGDMELDRFRSALSSMFTNDMMQSRYISVVDESHVYSVLTKLELDDAANLTQDNLRDIARETGVTHILKGTYIKLGDNYRVDVVLQDAGTLAPVAAERADGVGENSLFAMVDNLTKKLKLHFNLTQEEIENDLDGKISEVTTPNLRALEFYIEANKALNSRDFTKAIESLENAIALDPDFAIAYRILSGVYNRLYLEVDRNEDYWDKLEEYREKAFEAAQRRPPSERERLFIVASNQHNLVETFHTLYKLVNLFPDDENGNLWIGTVMRQQKEYELAKTFFEPLIRNNSHRQIAYFHLAHVYRAQGLYDEARKICELSIEKFPGNPMDYETMVSIYITERDFDNALLWCKKGYELDPNVFTNFGVMGHTYFFIGDLSRAEVEYRKQLDSELRSDRINGRLNLINVYNTQGRFDDILALADEAMQKDESSYQIRQHAAHVLIVKGNFEEALRQIELWDEGLRPLYLGELYSKMQVWKEVEDVVDALEKAYEKGMEEHLSGDWPEQIKNLVPIFARRTKRYSLRLQGLIEIARGNYDQAIRHLEHAKSLFRDLHDEAFAYIVEPLALACFEKGDWERAREEYESIGMMTYGRKNHGDIYVKSFYMLGKVYEKLGKKKEARKNYERFLELWKNADPGLPEPADARSRLAHLQN